MEFIKTRGRHKNGVSDEVLKTSVITINDVLEELSNENKRLLNELLFANKCLKTLIAFKTLIDSFSDKFKHCLESYECQVFEKLQKDIEEDLTQLYNHIKREENQNNPSFNDSNSDTNLFNDLNSIQIKDNRIDSQEVWTPIVESKPLLNNNYADNNSSADNQVLEEEEEFKLNYKIKRKVGLRLNDRPEGSAQSKRFLCDVDGCDRQFTTKRSLRKHIKSHSKKVYKCDFDGCEYQTTSPISFNIHTYGHKGVKRYKCDYESCGRAFRIESKLKFHNKYIDLNLKKRFKCGYIGCDYQTNKSIQLKKHKGIHEGVDPFIIRCPQPNCRRRFLTTKRFEEHKKSYHLKKENEISVNCPIEGCHTLFACDKTLNEHLSLHRKKMRALVEHKEFVCGELECNFSTDSSTELETHHKQHWFQLEFCCPVEGCDQRFRKSNLSLHIKGVHPEYNYKQRKFKCHICGHMSNSRESLQNHKTNVHTHFRFRCEWPGCDYTTIYRTQSNNHRRIHSSERNFLCEWPECHKSFKTNVALKEHLRIHTNDRKYECSWPGCSYSCTNSGNISKHRRVHIKD